MHCPDLGQPSVQYFHPALVDLFATSGPSRSRHSGPSWATRLPFQQQQEPWKPGVCCDGSVCGGVLKGGLCKGNLSLASGICCQDYPSDWGSRRARVDTSKSCASVRRDESGKKRTGSFQSGDTLVLCFFRPCLFLGPSLLDPAPSLFPSRRAPSGDQLHLNTQRFGVVGGVPLIFGPV